MSGISAGPVYMLCIVCGYYYPPFFPDSNRIQSQRSRSSQRKHKDFFETRMTASLWPLRGGSAGFLSEAAT
jgi:hypothetical protein